MNILVMANFLATASGNFINSLLELESRTKQLGWKMVFLFPLKDNDSECNWMSYIRDHGITVLTYSKKMSQQDIIDFLFQIIDDYEIDLIHSHFSCLYQTLLWNKDLHKKVRILFHDHMDYIAEEPVKPQLKKQIKEAKRYREYGLGVISVMKKKYRGYFLVPKKWYIPNGITFKRNTERSESREEVRATLGIGSEEKLCLFLGWDYYRKGLDIAIKAVQAARDQGVPLVLGVLGFEEAPDDTKLNEIRKKLKIEPNVDGVKFLKSREDMFGLYRATDVFLSASRTEAFSYAILEAISQNVPVVASNISGTKWCLNYTKSLKFPSENVDKCAKALIKAVSMREEPSNSNALVDNYNIDIWSEKVINAYRAMMK